MVLPRPFVAVTRFSETLCYFLAYFVVNLSLLPVRSLLLDVSDASCCLILSLFELSAVPTISVAVPTPVLLISCPCCPPSTLLPYNMFMFPNPMEVLRSVPSAFLTCENMRDGMVARPQSPPEAS